jgi:hypothetical protein
LKISGNQGRQSNVGSQKCAILQFLEAYLKSSWNWLVFLLGFIRQYFLKHIWIGGIVATMFRCFLHCSIEKKSPRMPQEVRVEIWYFNGWLIETRILDTMKENYYWNIGEYNGGKTENEGNNQSSINSYQS